MFKWFTYLTTLPKIVALIREVLELVRHAEDLVVGGKRGAEKKALVLAILDNAIALGDKLGVPEAKGVDRAKLQAVVGEVVDALVGVLNNLGLFKPGTPSA